MALANAMVGMKKELYGRGPTAAKLMSAVQELLSRRVLTYHSEIVFNPPRTFEIFVLEPETD